MCRTPIALCPPKRPYRTPVALYQREAWQVKLSSEKYRAIFHVHLNSVQQMVSGELAGECLPTGFERHRVPPQRAPLDTVYALREHLNSVQRMVSGGYCDGLFPDTVCWTRLRNTWIFLYRSYGHTNCGSEWELLVHMNCKGNSYWPIPWCLVLRGSLHAPMSLKVHQKCAPRLETWSMDGSSQICDFFCSDLPGDAAVKMAGISSELFCSHPFPT